MSSLKLNRVSTKVFGDVIVRGSKSISNRILIIRELSGTSHPVENLSLSDDTKCLHDHLRRINNNNNPGLPLEVDAKNAGTVARFLTAFLAYKKGNWIVTGNQRMKQRPIKGLVDGLRQLGAQITYKEEEGFLPLLIIGGHLKSNDIEVDVTESSQFISAIMMLGPLLNDGLKINFKWKPVSFPYIEMTISIMQDFGAKIELHEKGIKIAPTPYVLKPCKSESDWSSASYWYETIALSDEGEIRIPELGKNSLQGDSILADIYKQFGVKTIFDTNGIKLIKTGNAVKSFSFNFEDYPDIVPAVMTTCAALHINSEYHNIGHLEFKESNRITALSQELEKIGAILTKVKNSYHLTTNIKEPDTNLVFNTYGDHRIAMCLSPLVLKFMNIEINDPNVVNKSYPEFWDELKKLKFAVLKTD